MSECNFSSQEYPPTLPPSELEVCTEDYFFAHRDFSVLRALSMKNYSIGMHIHDFYEINIVLGGSGIHYVEDRIYHLRRGHVFVIPPRLRHGYYNCGGLEVFHILVSLRFLNRYRSELAALPGYLPLFNIHPILRVNTNHSFFLELSTGEIDSLQEQLYQLLSLKPNADGLLRDEQDLLLCTYGMRVIIMLCAAYRRGLADSDETFHPEKHGIIADSLQYIYENYNKKISAQALADQVYLSYSAYERLFRDTLGMTPTEFITDCRLTEAKHLLESTELSVTEIAHRVGFYDSSHFYRSFFRKNGVSPSQYRITCEASEGKK